MSSEVLDSYVDVPGGKVFVRRWRPDACGHSPIVLLHDSLGCVDMWRDFPLELAEVTSREVIAYDRLGFGKSTSREALPAVTFIAEEAEIYFPAIRSALGVDCFSLFGHSVGGAMAVTIAASHSDVCDAVITESAQAFVEERTLSGIRVAKQQFTDPAQLNKLARWHGDKARWVLAAWTDTWLSAPFQGWSLEDELSKVICPVLAIHGDLDEYGSVEFPKRIAGGVSCPSQLMILENCGHVPHRERKQDVLRGTAAFLERHAR